MAEALHTRVAFSFPVSSDSVAIITIYKAAYRMADFPFLLKKGPLQGWIRKCFHLPYSSCSEVELWDWTRPKETAADMWF